MFEVAAGKLAETKGSTQDVRDFATAEVHDHMLVGNKLKAISSSEGVAFSATPNAEFAGKLSRLSGLSGKAFDAAYLSEMATLHDGDGAAFAKESGDGGSPAYRAFGAETHRIVQRHIGAIHAVPVS
jgi:putative membrane protein